MSRLSVCIVLIVVAAAAYVDAEIVNVQYKSPVTLNCTLSGEKAEFFRVENGTDGVPVDAKDVDGKQFTIKDPHRSDIMADYYCTVPGRTAKQTFEMRAAPYVKKPEKASLTVTEGGDAQMHCAVLYGNEQYGNVDPRKNGSSRWVWRRNGTVIELSDRAQYETQGNQTTLKLSKLVLTDHGDYECFLKNDHGEHSEHVTLRVKSQLAVLWPFLAIVAEVLLLSAIIIIYEMKCSKKPVRESDEPAEQHLMGADASGQTDLKKRTAKA